MRPTTKRLRPFKRLDEADLGKLNAYHQPNYEPDANQDNVKRYVETARETSRFMAVNSMRLSRV
jgi:hypothetical protein